MISLRQICSDIRAVYNTGFCTPTSPACPLYSRSARDVIISACYRSESGTTMRQPRSRKISGTVAPLIKTPVHLQVQLLFFVFVLALHHSGQMRSCAIIFDTFSVEVASLCFIHHLLMLMRHWGPYLSKFSLQFARIYF